MPVNRSQWQRERFSPRTASVPARSDQLMTSDELRQILESVRTGRTDVESAIARLGSPAVADLGFAQVDLDRRARCGFPEVIFCEGKTAEWVESVVRRLAEAKQ